MRQFQSFVVGISLSLLAGMGTVACGTSTIDEFEALRDEVCACTTQACVDEVQKKSKALESKLGKLSADEQEKSFAIAEEIMACTKRIQRSGS